MGVCRRQLQQAMAHLISRKTHFSDNIPALSRNLGKGLFEDAAVAAGLARAEPLRASGAPGWPDFDNDGLADLVLRHRARLSGDRARSLLEAVSTQGPARRCSAISATAASKTSTRRAGPGVTTPHSSRGAAFGDFDNDGDVDALVMNMNEPPSLLRNDYARRATAGSRCCSKARSSNRAAIGATVIVTAAGRRQARAVLSQSSYYSHDDLRLHTFGLGAAARVDDIEVRWPNGGCSR